MLSPKRTKYRKMQKGRVRGEARRGQEVSFGDYAKALQVAVDEIGYDQVRTLQRAGSGDGRLIGVMGAPAGDLVIFFLAGWAIDAMLGPTGNLRAPTLRVGTTLLVGFDERSYRDALT